LTWAIAWKPQALREFLRLAANVQDRIEGKLVEAQRDPARVFKRLKGTPLSSMRVGDYRVIALVAGSVRIVTIQRVGHRSAVYER
jgi:mRNA-degrading endonuclease RelE of RelBE toxin-antitoxin system